MEANKDNLHLYNTNLQPFANALRKRMTKAEACLWKYALRASQLKGYPFRRQRPVLNYIADFMCKDLMLIIEVDGITHHDEKVIENDKRRQAELERAGFTVLRFTDNEVLKGIAGVIAELEEWIEKQEANKSHPQPPPEGDTLGVIN
jgi:very-short-patch-repair endonuclease